MQPSRPSNPAAPRGGWLHGPGRRRRERADRALSDVAAARRADDAALVELRRTAGWLAARIPGWVIWAGPATRQLWAMPLWDPGHPIILSSPDPYELVRRIRRTDQLYGCTGPADVAAAPAPERTGGRDHHPGPLRP